MQGSPISNRRAFIGSEHGSPRQKGFIGSEDNPPTDETGIVSSSSGMPDTGITPNAITKFRVAHLGIMLSFTETKADGTQKTHDLRQLEDIKFHGKWKKGFTLENGVVVTARKFQLWGFPLMTELTYHGDDSGNLHKMTITAVGGSPTTFTQGGVKYQAQGFTFNSGLLGGKQLVLKDLKLQDRDEFKRLPVGYFDTIDFATVVRSKDKKSGIQAGITGLAKHLKIELDDVNLDNQHIIRAIANHKKEDIAKQLEELEKVQREVAEVQNKLNKAKEDSKTREIRNLEKKLGEKEMARVMAMLNPKAPGVEWTEIREIETNLEAAKDQHRAAKIDAIKASTPQKKAAIEALEADLSDKRAKRDAKYDELEHADKSNPQNLQKLNGELEETRKAVSDADKKLEEEDGLKTDVVRKRENELNKDLTAKALNILNALGDLVQNEPDGIGENEGKYTLAGDDALIDELSMHFDPKGKLRNNPLHQALTELELTHTKLNKEAVENAVKIWANDPNADKKGPSAAKDLAAIILKEIDRLEGNRKTAKGFHAHQMQMNPFTMGGMKGLP